MAMRTCSNHWITDKDSVIRGESFWQLVEVLLGLPCRPHVKYPMVRYLLSDALECSQPQYLGHGLMTRQECCKVR